MSASVFLSTWRDEGVILYEVNPRYHTREEAIILGCCHGVSRYYHLPDHREQLTADCRLWEATALDTWLDGLTVPKAPSGTDTDRSPQVDPVVPAPVADSWDPAMHPPIL